MARLDTLSEEIVWDLTRSASPEPKAVDLQGHRPAAVMFFVRDVIDACTQRAVPIARVEVGPVVGYELLRQFGGDSQGYHGVKICCSEHIEAKVQFIAHAPEAAAPAY